MIDNKSIAVVFPAYNEEQQIEDVIFTMPDYVDRIIIVDDCSKDKTKEVVLKLVEKSGKRPLPKKKAKNSNKFSRAMELVDKTNREEIKYFVDADVSENGNNRLILISLNRNSGVGAAIARGYKWCKDKSIDCTAVMAGEIISKYLIAILSAIIPITGFSREGNL